MIEYITPFIYLSALPAFFSIMYAWDALNDYEPRLKTFFAFFSCPFFGFQMMVFSSLGGVLIYHGGMCLGVVCVMWAILSFDVVRRSENHINNRA